MNRLTNEQRLQIIEFYNQNASSVKKVHRALLPFYGQLIFGSMGTLISRIVDFGVKISQKHCKSYKRIQKKSQFCAVYGLVASYFFKDDANRNVTVNGERYHEMISNFVLPKMQGFDLHDMWFQQDGAACHTAR